MGKFMCGFKCLRGQRQEKQKYMVAFSLRQKLQMMEHMQDKKKKRERSKTADDHELIYNFLFSRAVCIADRSGKAMKYHMKGRRAE